MKRFIILLLICGSCAAEEQEPEPERELPTFQEMADSGIETYPEAIEYIKNHTDTAGRLHIGAYAAEYIEMLEYHRQWTRDHKDKHTDRRTGRGF